MQTKHFFLLVLIPLVSSTIIGSYSLSMATPNTLQIFSTDTSSSNSMTLITQILTGGNGVGNGAVGSQGSLIATGNFLIGVNPSSNSISAFSVDPNNVTNVKLLNSVSSGGEWPMSVTAFGTTV